MSPAEIIIIIASIVALISIVILIATIIDAIIDDKLTHEFLYDMQGTSPKQRDEKHQQQDKEVGRYGW